MIRKLFIISYLFLFVAALQAQELNARIVINSDKVQGSNKQVYETLQKALTEFINTKKWTGAKFAPNERIDCHFTIIIEEAEDNQYKGEIQVQARRPVYNSSYVTTLLNFRDVQFNFEYVEYEPLEYTETSLNSNLTATIVFYIYTILGLDFDSFSLKGGVSFFRQAQQIVSMAQSEAGWLGWKAFDSDKNRHALITALTENTADAFHDFWYAYHRKGLDEMAANSDRARATILNLIPNLKKIYEVRPTSPLLKLFSDSKLDELIAIFEKATNQEKKEGYEFLINLYPTEENRLLKLKE